MASLVTAISSIAGVLGGDGSFLTNPLVKILGGIGLQYAGNKLSKKKKKKANDSGQGGTQLEAQSGGSQPREIGVGLFATAGQEICTPITFGKENKTAERIIILSDFRIDGVNRVAINNIWCDLTGDNNSERGYGVTGETSELIHIKLFKGDPNQSADPYLVKNAGGRWTDQYRGAGLSYVIVSVDYDKEKMTSFPRLLFECRGVSYDPRFDSSVGGDGNQRFEDPMTWEYSENPIVQAYTYSRGFHINGQLIIGKGMPARDLPLSAWIPAMNVCDETLTDEGYQKRYRAGTIFTADGNVTHDGNIQPLLDACAGDLVERVDGDIPLVGMTHPVVAHLTEDDIIIGEKTQYKAKRSRTELINAIFGSYNEPEKCWDAVAYPAQINNEAQNADGERHARQIDFKAVFSAQQAARLAQTAVRKNRYQATAAVVVRPRWVTLEVGDWIDFTFKDFGTKTYEIRSRSLAALGANGARNVTLTLQEVGTGIYDNTVDIPELPPVIPPLKPALQQFPEGLRVVATTTEGEGKRKIPTIVVSWDPPTDIITVRGVLIELWKTSEAERKIQFQVLQPQNSYAIIGGLLPHENYSIRTTVIPEPYRMTLWSDTKRITTLNEEYDFEKVKEEIGELNKWAAFDQASIRRELEKMSSVASDAAAFGFTNAQSIKRELTISLNDARAEYTEQIVVAASKTAALAEKLETVKAELNGSIASSINAVKAEINYVDGRVTATTEKIETVKAELNGSITSSINALKTEVNYIDGRVTATTEKIELLSAQIGDVSSSITTRAHVEASPGDNWARYTMQVKTGSGNNWSMGAFYIDVKEWRSRVVFLADQFIIADPNQTFQPFVFENGKLKLQAANIGEVESCYLCSPSKRMIFDLNNEQIAVSD